MTGRVSLTVNGRRVQSTAEPRTHLADFLRDHLRLTGTHVGCEHGVCGACTVLVDGAPIRSCIAYAVACEGGDVRTIEAFDHDPLMQALRDAFTRRHALQCGYCTPGMLITAYDVVRRLPDADEARVREELSGNLCRCTGYVGIVEAVTGVLEEARAFGDEGPATAVTAFESAPDVDVVSACDTAQEARVRRAFEIVEDSRRDASAHTTPNSTARTQRPRGPLSAASESLASTRPGGPAFTHEIAVQVAPDRLWFALQDIALVVRCLPGATLLGPADADPLSLELSVTIGPMRARFEGTAHVAFDGRSRTGTFDGSGYDARTRSSSEGHVEFSVRASDTADSVLVLAMRYTTRGPLAQFSRGAVIHAIVDQILEEFATNLAAAATGREVGASPPLGGFGLAIAVVRKWLGEKLSARRD